MPSIINEDVLLRDKVGYAKFNNRELLPYEGLVLEISKRIQRLNTYCELGLCPHPLPNTLEGMFPIKLRGIVMSMTLSKRADEI